MTGKIGKQTKPPERVQRFCRAFYEALVRDSWGDIDPYLFRNLGEGEFSDEGIKDADEGDAWTRSISQAVDEALAEIDKRKGGDEDVS